VIFTEKDIQQIEAHQLSVNDINQQIHLFNVGIPFVNLKESATLNNGIITLSRNEQDNLVAKFEQNISTFNVVKFVPASGAATRMFKFLFEFVANYNLEKESINSYINKNNAKDLSLFFIALEKLPFYDEVLLKSGIKNGVITDAEKLHFVNTLLNNHGNCNYGYIPKGLLPFHKYKNHKTTAFGEHLFEAVQYASKNNVAKLHFTIWENHNKNFEEEFERIEKVISNKTNTKFEISYSSQKNKTDTIAVDLNNNPFRNQDGTLLFRPSGHGALIENLNDLEADIIFIKNIDNVVTSQYEKEVAYYKKTLGGLLMQLQDQIFAYQEIFDTQSDITEATIIAIANFLQQKLNVNIHKDFEKFATKYQIEYLKNKINRPLRVCGMVKNEGEPGGGPFWVKAESGEVSLQIIESAQINKNSKQQEEILTYATHFNPVDLVCGVKNYKGEKYNLLDFVDEKAYFISTKSKNGKKLKALERPGLWNGAMANWNTVFVEVPLITFNPVKTVNDLFKSAHQIT